MLHRLIFPRIQIALDAWAMNLSSHEAVSSRSIRTAPQQLASRMNGALSHGPTSAVGKSISSA
ncbi:MAG: hypothetical protein NTW07_00050, partial [candidate division Zixibacteria bacterium]|nr:hypothetical protein [candidate division Zixibacteria bacterium]